MNIAECHQQSLSCYVLSRTVVFGFPLGSRTCPGLGSCQEWVRLMEWVLVPYSQCGWVFSRLLYHYCTRVLCRQITVMTPEFVAGLAFPFLLRQCTEHFQYCEHWSGGMKKVLGRHQIGFYVISELCRCCLQQEVLTIRLWRATNILVVQGLPMGLLYQ